MIARPVLMPSAVKLGAGFCEYPRARPGSCVGVATTFDQNEL